MALIIYLYPGVTKQNKYIHLLNVFGGSDVRGRELKVFLFRLFIVAFCWVAKIRTNKRKGKHRQTMSVCLI